MAGRWRNDLREVKVKRLRQRQVTDKNGHPSYKRPWFVDGRRTKQLSKEYVTLQNPGLAVFFVIMNTYGAEPLNIVTCIARQRRDKHLA
jgi:hypothetical protein